MTSAKLTMIRGRPYTQESIYTVAKERKEGRREGRGKREGKREKKRSCLDKIKKKKKASSHNMLPEISIKLKDKKNRGKKKRAEKRHQANTNHKRAEVATVLLWNEL